MRLRVTVLVVGLGLGGPAARADEVDALGGKVMELDTRIRDLDAQLKPPAEPGAEIAERRLIDAQVLYELKNYEAASIILFDVVEKFPASSAYPEALFYLADSLYLKRDFLSSRRFFEKIVDVGPSNRRYQESLQRLIELSLHTGDYSPVDGYIAKLEAMPPGQQLAEVPYVKGKYFFFRQQFDRALDSLKVIGPTHTYYFHALYFIGAAQVAQGGDKVNEAVLAFSTILKTEAKTDAQKRIAELAHMALARIDLDRGQLTNALDEYGKISTKSDLFNDALYESAWVSIKGKDFVKARRSLDLMLTNSPDSPLAPQVKLLIGSLHIRELEYGPATEMFSKTRDEYQPIQKQLEDELAKTGDAKKYFRELISKNLAKFDTSVVLTPAAQKWVKPEPEVERVATLIGDEAELRKSLDESEEIVRRLEKALNGPARVNVFPELAGSRTKAVEIANQLTEVKQQLARREAQLIAPVVGTEKGTLDGLQREREALEAQLVTLPAKADAIADRQMKAKAAFNEVDKRAAELQTMLNGMKGAVAATRQLYHDKVDKSFVVDPPPGPPAPVRPDSAQVGYVQRTQQLTQRVGELKDQLARDQERVSSLKDMVLQGIDARVDLMALTSEVESMQQGVGGLRKDIEDAASQVGVDDVEMQAAAKLKAQYDDVLRRQHAMGVQVRARLGGGERGKAEQIESIIDRTHGVDQKIATFNQRIEAILDVRLKDIQGALVEEKAHVAAYRQTLGGYTTESTDVGGGIVAENFKNVARRFYEVVVRADVGIIDVAWALKDSATKETSRLVSERKRELKLLDDEFKQVLKEQP